MDSEEIREILTTSKIKIWELIDAAIRVASSDHCDELLRRRDKIVETLFTAAPQLCHSCNNQNDVIHDKNEDFVSKSPLTPESNEYEDVDPFGRLFDEDDDEQTTIVSIKERLEDPDQSEGAVVELLQSLADMDISFQALKETDIGRHVNRLRKHSSNDVRKLVKQLVRTWKEEWVKVNQPQGTSNLIDGSSSVERNYAEPETKHKPPQSAPRKEALSRPQQSAPKSASAPPNRAPRVTVVDDERLNSASRRLQENYQEAQNAKRQRTIQVMDIHEIPKPKNGFFAKNKGGFQGRHHR